MPGYFGMGPYGYGPGPGWGRGPGAGLGRGFGGGGWSRWPRRPWCQGRGGWGPPPWWSGSYGPGPYWDKAAYESPQEERDDLQEQEMALRARIEAIHRRLNELEQVAPGE